MGLHYINRAYQSYYRTVHCAIVLPDPALVESRKK